MSQAKSQVQVTITGNLDKGFNQAFQAADKRMGELGKRSSELSKQIGNVDAFRQQKRAVVEAEAAWKSATARVAELKRQIAATGEPTRKQAAELNKATREAQKASAAFNDQRVKLADMRKQLQTAGVSVKDLASEYRRLQGELAAVGTQTERLSRIQSQADRESIQRQHRLEDVLRRRRLEQEREAAALARMQARLDRVARAWAGVGTAAQKAGGMAAGAMAGGAVLAQPIKKGLSYEEQLARLADTAVAGGGDYAGAKSTLSGAVQGALASAGGGTREQGISALNTLIATGGLDTAQAVKELPAIMRAAFASNTDAGQIASLALKMRSFGVNDSNAGLNILYRSGQVGGVELKDMAQYLPEQLASARSAGYSGKEGLAQIGAMNQVAYLTAGDASTAANNVTNLLNKLSSPELAKNIDKVADVDFNKYALANQKKGIYKAESFAMLADQQMQKNAQYRKLQSQLKGAKTDDERRAKINEMAAMLEGSSMGQFIQDRQALAAALALVDARRRKDDADPTKTVLQRQYEFALNGTGGVDQSLQNLRGENFAKTQVASERLNAANERTMQELSGPIGQVLDGFNNLTQEFPKLTTAAYGAATALGAVAAAGIGMGAYNWLTKPNGAKLPTGPGSLSATAGAAGAAGAGAASRLGMIGRAGVAGVAIYGGLKAAEYAGLPNVDEDKGRQAWKNGEYLKASAYMPAGDFLKAVWDKVSGTDDTAKKAAEAAQETAKAATTAAGRPNVTVNNTVTVTAPPGADTAQMQAMFNKAMQEAERRMKADMRSNLSDRLGY